MKAGLGFWCDGSNTRIPVPASNGIRRTLLTYPKKASGAFMAPPEQLGTNHFPNFAGDGWGDPQFGNIPPPRPLFHRSQPNPAFRYIFPRQRFQGQSYETPMGIGFGRPFLPPLLPRPSPTPLMLMNPFHLSSFQPRRRPLLPLPSKTLPNPFGPSNVRMRRVCPSVLPVVPLMSLPTSNPNGRKELPSPQDAPPRPRPRPRGTKRHNRRPESSPPGSPQRKRECVVKPWKVSPPRILDSRIRSPSVMQNQS